MTELTVEKMDLINFLLTEVSLELLGNTFFDVFGQKSNGLNHLLSMKSAKVPEGYSERTSDLLNTLGLSIFDLNEDDFSESDEPNGPEQPKKPRRLTESKSTGETVTKEVEQESLLIPLRKTSAPTQIRHRRKTVVDTRPTLKRQHVETGPSALHASKRPNTPNVVPKKKIDQMKHRVELGSLGNDLFLVIHRH